jgi:formylglycine-generating enzyme required for sulfatase activity
MSGKIFINYRRDDSAAWAGRLADRLKNHFPSNQIFMDVDTIEPGVDFVEAVEEVVGACDVLIAVIGAQWLTSSDRRGKRRLDIPKDLVRLEIAIALKRGIRVVPVLVEGVKMPEAGELPDDLKALVRRNALEINHTRFSTDSDRLVIAVERALQKATEQREAEENGRSRAQQQERLDREQRERAAVEIREYQEKEQQDARREQKRLEQERGSQPPKPISPVVPSAPPKTEGDKTSGETRRVVNLVPPEREKPSPLGGSGRKAPSKHLVALFAIAALLVLVGLIYLAIRLSQSSSPSPAPIAAVTPTPTVTAAPTQAAAVKPSGQPTAPVAVASPNPSISVTSTKEETARIALDKATTAHPWVNSLGMKFVPVAGVQVLFSVWDTRVQDFEIFVQSTGYDPRAGMWSLAKDGYKQSGATWKQPGFSQGPAHPVVGVSWNDAEEFCKWLTQRERTAGDLTQEREYRLPTDAEWSAAVGLKNEEGRTPEEKSGKIKLYPWDIPRKRDKSWPPPAGSGNYRGEEVRNPDWPSGWQVIEDYNDGYPRTSPVESFAVNQSGLYDMGGNVWQWCEDWYNSNKQYRVWRGASWDAFVPDVLLASYRRGITPGERTSFTGFRCVVAVESLR